jgi:hypothetical protein
MFYMVIWASPFARSALRVGLFASSPSQMRRTAVRLICEGGSAAIPLAAALLGSFLAPKKMPFAKITN